MELLQTMNQNNSRDLEELLQQAIRNQAVIPEELLNGNLEYQSAFKAIQLQAELDPALNNSLIQWIIKSVENSISLKNREVLLSEYGRWLVFFATCISKIQLKDSLTLQATAKALIHIVNRSESRNAKRLCEQAVKRQPALGNLKICKSKEFLNRKSAQSLLNKPLNEELAKPIEINSDQVLNRTILMKNGESIDFDSNAKARINRIVSISDTDQLREMLSFLPHQKLGDIAIFLYSINLKKIAPLIDVEVLLNVCESKNITLLDLDFSLTKPRCSEILNSKKLKTIERFLHREKPEQVSFLIKQAYESKNSALIAQYLSNMYYHGEFQLLNNFLKRLDNKSLGLIFQILYDHSNVQELKGLYRILVKYQQLHASQIRSIFVHHKDVFRHIHSIDF